MATFLAGVPVIRAMQSTVCLTALLACSEGPSSKLTSTRSQVGDTTVVTIHGPQLLAIRSTIPSVESVWSPPDLRAVRSIAVGDRVIVATDGRRVVGLSRESGATFAVGANGEGPGEYRRVSSVAIDQAGQIMAIDPLQRRVLSFDATGRPLTEGQRQLDTESSWNVSAAIATDPGAAAFLISWDHGLIDVDGLEDSMRVMHIPSRDSATVLFVVPEGQWGTIGGVPAKRQAYGPRALVALDEADGAAVSTGTGYTIRWWRPGAQPAMLRIEREWRNAPTGSELEPDQSLLDGLGPTGEMLRRIAAGQERSERKNAIDHLVLVGQGRLLAKVVDSTARYHPYYLGRLPELRPPHWTWELFDTEGVLLGQLLLPSAFTPVRMLGCQLWGSLEELDGTQAVARADLGEACGWMR